MIEKKQEKAEQKTGLVDIFLQYRIRISLFIMLVGFGLFLLQINTTGRTARPDQAFTLLLFQDYSARNVYLHELDERVEIDPGAVPGVEQHYRGEPLPGFEERFQKFSAGMPASEQFRLLPIHMRRSPVESSRIEIPLAYIVMQMELEDTRAMLADVVSPAEIEIGDQFLGPWPYSVPPTREQLQQESAIEFEQTPQKLPGEASALQGIVIQVVEEVSVNAYVIIPSGNTDVGDYAMAVNEFSQQIAQPYRKQLQAGDNPEYLPNFRFSDIRHGGFTYFFVLLGQVLVLAGGFLLCYHFIEKYGEKEHENSNFIKQTIVDTCRLISQHHRLYAISVAIFLLFWAYGMVNAYMNPAAQEEMITTYQTVFSGSSWPLGFTAQSYQRGDILTASVMTFLVNFFWGTVVILTLLSVIPIGSAFIINALRGQTIGMVLAPTKAFFGLAMVPHLITMILELQGYLIAGFVAILLPLAMIRPASFGCDSVLQAFKKYLVWQFRVLPLIAIILAIAAVYEAVELILVGQLF